jgi:hypothetical protein
MYGLLCVLALLIAKDESFDPVTLLPWAWNVFVLISEAIALMIRLQRTMAA